MLKLFDIHTHTTYSDGRSPIGDNVRAAETSGLSVVAITDHYFLPKDAEWIDKMISEVRSIKSKVKVLAGVEGMILNPEGEISVNGKIAKKLDLVLVDMGVFTEGIFLKPPVKKKELIGNIIKAYINVCKNPIIDIIAHPFNLGRLLSKVYLSDFRQEDLIGIAQALVKSNKVFEIMNLMPWWFPNTPIDKFTKDYCYLVKIFAQEGVRFSVGSDAHSCCGVGNLIWAKRVLEEANIENQLIDPGVFIND